MIVFFVLLWGCNTALQTDHHTVMKLVGAPSLEKKALNFPVTMNLEGLPKNIVNYIERNAERKNDYFIFIRIEKRDLFALPTSLTKEAASQHADKKDIWKTCAWNVGDDKKLLLYYVYTNPEVFYFKVPILDLVEKNNSF